MLFRSSTTIAIGALVAARGCTHPDGGREHQSRRARIRYLLTVAERARILLGTPIDDQIANLIVAQLLFLEHEDPDRDIWLYINSPGGSITAGLAIYDTMQVIRPDVATVCVGMAGSMATPILAGGAKGKRYSLPHSTIHMHPAGGGARGYAPDVEIMARELLREQQLIRELLAKDTGQPLERIARDFDRDLFMDPQQAKEYGIIDEILTREDLPAAGERR